MISAFGIEHVTKADARADSQNRVRYYGSVANAAGGAGALAGAGAGVAGTLAHLEGKGKNPLGLHYAQGAVRTPRSAAEAARQHHELVEPFLREHRGQAKGLGAAAAGSLTLAAAYKYRQQQERTRQAQLGKADQPQDHPGRRRATDTALGAAALGTGGVGVRLAHTHGQKFAAVARGARQEGNVPFHELRGNKLGDWGIPPEELEAHRKTLKRAARVYAINRPAALAGTGAAILGSAAAYRVARGPHREPQPFGKAATPEQNERGTHYQRMSRAMAGMGGLATAVGGGAGVVSLLEHHGHDPIGALLPDDPDRFKPVPKKPPPKVIARFVKPKPGSVPSTDEEKAAADFQHRVRVRQLRPYAGAHRSQAAWLAGTGAAALGLSAAYKHKQNKLAQQVGKADSRKHRTSDAALDAASVGVGGAGVYMGAAYYNGLNAPAKEFGRWGLERHHMMQAAKHDPENWGQVEPQHLAHAKAVRSAGARVYGYKKPAALGVAGAGLAGALAGKEVVRHAVRSQQLKRQPTPVGKSALSEAYAQGRAARAALAAAKAKGLSGDAYAGAKIAALKPRSTGLAAATGHHVGFNRNAYLGAALGGKVALTAGTLGYGAYRGTQAHRNRQARRLQPIEQPEQPEQPDLFGKALFGPSGVSDKRNTKYLAAGTAGGLAGLAAVQSHPSFTTPGRAAQQLTGHDDMVDSLKQLRRAGRLNEVRDADTALRNARGGLLGGVAAGGLAYGGYRALRGKGRPQQSEYQMGLGPPQ